MGRRSRLPDPRPQVPQQLNFQIFSIFSLTRKHERRDRVSRRRKRATRHQRGLGERAEAAALSVDSDSWSSPDRGVSLHRWQTLQTNFMSSAQKFPKKHPYPRIGLPLSYPTLSRCSCTHLLSEEEGLPHCELLVFEEACSYMMSL